MSADDIELERTGPRAWRICDQSVVDGDARHVIAEVAGGIEGYEVNWMRDSHRQTRYADLDDILNDVHASRHHARSAGPTRPPHRPPPSRRR